MKVLVTGGTGFVGSYTVKAFVEAGHRVKLLVRAEERVAEVLEPLGIPTDELVVVVGDVTDASAVEEAVQDCDALLHTAFCVSFDSRHYREVRRVNAPGTELVLGTAARLGLNPIIFVSAHPVLFPPEKDELLTPDSALRRWRIPGAYIRSKIDCERIARELQETCDAVTITYPGGCIGGRLPRRGAGFENLVIDVLKAKRVMLPAGGVYVNDVRDVAALHAKLLEDRHALRRVVVPGHFVSTREIVEILSKVTGRELLTRGAPPMPIVKVMGRLASLAQRILPFPLELNQEVPYLVACSARVDDSPAREQLGVTPRPIADSFAESVRCLLEQGHLTAEQAGQLGHGGAK